MDQVLHFLLDHPRRYVTPFGCWVEQRSQLTAHCCKVFPLPVSLPRHLVPRRDFVCLHVGDVLLIFFIWTTY